MNKKNHFKFFCTAANGFIEQYKYNGYVDELFEDPLLIPCQHTSVQDSYGNYIYENDVIEFERPVTNKESKKHTAFITFYDGAFLVLAQSVEEDKTLSHMWLHDLTKQIFNWKVKVIGTTLTNIKTE